MKYDIIPTIRGVKRADLLDMSMSPPFFLAQYKIMIKGIIDVKTSRINSTVMNFDRLNTPFSNDIIYEIIKNNGMQIIGGCVIVEIALAILILSM